MKIQPKKITPPAKNIRKLEDGTIYFVDQYTENGKKIRRFYKSQYEREQARAARKTAQYSSIKKIAEAELSPETLLDIGNALKILPPGMTLSKCVEIATKQTAPEKPFEQCLEEFMLTKKNIDRHSQTTAKNRILKFFNTYGGFEAATAENVLKFIREVSPSEKSRKHHAAALKEFFEWLQVRRYFLANPFLEIHRSDLPRPQKAKRKRIPVKDIAGFFAECEKLMPQYAGICALAAFGGLRMSEACALKAENIKAARREIVVPFDISKTGKRSGKTYLQANMPPNVWDWLKKYPLGGEETLDIYKNLKNLPKWKKLPDNALRHSFATYHLSLFRNPGETALLMRHKDQNQLWNTYLDELCDEKEAEKYFEIRPTSA
ncbi:MAG: hypothetical protein J6T16_05525 [Opitutales bacterium]|nr:hypothetical protein [Opitutales bacterium]